MEKIKLNKNILYVFNALFMVLIQAAFIASAFADYEYDVKILQGPNGQNLKFPYAINNTGGIVGTTELFPEHDSNRVFFLNGDKFYQNLITLPNPPYADHWVGDLNDRGQVVGSVADDNGFNFHSPFIFQNGEMTDLGLRQGLFNAVALPRINNLGEIVGGPGATKAYMSYCINCSVPFGDIEVFSPYFIAQDIGDNSIIVGVDYTPGFPTRPMRAIPTDSGYKTESLQKIVAGITAESPMPEYLRVNKWGIVLLTAIVPNSAHPGLTQQRQPVIIRTDDTAYTLGLLPGGELSGYGTYAMAINNHCEVVGKGGLHSSTSLKAFVWNSAKGVRDLNTLIDPNHNLDLYTAFDVSDLGQIVAGGIIGNDAVGVLLTPREGVEKPGCDKLILEKPAANSNNRVVEIIDIAIKPRVLKANSSAQVRVKLKFPKLLKKAELELAPLGSSTDPMKAVIAKSMTLKCNGKVCSGTIRPKQLYRAEAETKSRYSLKVVLTGKDGTVTSKEAKSITVEPNKN